MVTDTVSSNYGSSQYVLITVTHTVSFNKFQYPFPIIVANYHFVIIVKFPLMLKEAKK